MSTGGFKANGQDGNSQRISFAVYECQLQRGYMSEESNYKAHRVSSRRASAAHQLGPSGEKKQFSW